VQRSGHRLPTIAGDAWRKDDFRRAARAAAAAVDWSAVGERVRERLATWLAGRPPTTVVVYLARPDEPSVGELAVRPDLASHRWAVTRPGSTGVDLTLHPFDAEREWHRYGYQQPVAGSPLVAEAEIGVVLVPGLAFDHFGARLGRGKGYYDRLLARLGPGVDLVGVTADALVSPLPLPMADHDVPMGWLATESGVAPALADHP
jgi:5-formyltetrahydrofolate cyclo-ligase